MPPGALVALTYHTACSGGPAGDVDLRAAVIAGVGLATDVADAFQQFHSQVRVVLVGADVLGGDAQNSGSAVVAPAGGSAIVDGIYNVLTVDGVDDGLAEVQLTQPGVPDGVDTELGDLGGAAADPLVRAQPVGVVEGDQEGPVGLARLNHGGAHRSLCPPLPLDLLELGSGVFGSLGGGNIAIELGHDDFATPVPAVHFVGARAGPDGNFSKGVFTQLFGRLGLRHVQAAYEQGAGFFANDAGGQVVDQIHFQ